jgi:hypothetical protein
MDWKWEKCALFRCRRTVRSKTCPWKESYYNRIIIELRILFWFLIWYQFVDWSLVRFAGHWLSSRRSTIIESIFCTFSDSGIVSSQNHEHVSIWIWLSNFWASRKTFFSCPRSVCPLRMALKVRENWLFSGKCGIPSSNIEINCVLCGGHWEPDYFHRFDGNGLCSTITNWMLSAILITLKGFHKPICFMINSCIHWFFGLGLVGVVWRSLKNCTAAGHSLEKWWSLLSYNHGIISFIHQLITLWEEFICAGFGHLVNLNIKFIAQAQRRYLAKEN